MVFRRLGDGPFITREDIPDIWSDVVDATSVFNPGAISLDGIDCLLLRVQTRGRRTLLMPARVENGRAIVSGTTTYFQDLPGQVSGEAMHVYDPRITGINGQVYVVTAVDTTVGCRLVIWKAWSNDVNSLIVLEPCGSLGETDSRNGVLFPEKIGGRFAMLHRPNIAQAAGDPASGSAIVLSYSDDLENWDEGRPVMAGRPTRWDELIGSGPPPIKTSAGWLHLYHGIATHFQSVNIYQAGVVLLDLEDPSRVISRGTDNVLEPREMWEMVGQVPNVVFPSGWTVSKTDPDGTVPRDAVVRLYYGAADTCVGCAETTVEELIVAARR